MTESSYPFDAGAGSGVPDEAAWSNMLRSAWRGGDGVIRALDRTFDLNRLECYADSTGMRVKVKSGRAQLRGFHYVSDAEVVLTIANASLVNPRIDRVVLHLDTTANTIALEVMTGTAAASPVAPTITDTATQFRLPLATVLVGTSVSTIAAGNVTRNEPSLVSGLTPMCIVTRGAVQSIAHGNLIDIVWSSGLVDNDGCSSSAGFTCQTKGAYSITVSIEWGVTQPTGLRIVYIYLTRVGASGVAIAKSAMTATAGETAQVLSAHEAMNIGDAIKVTVIQSNATGTAAIDILATASSTPRLSVVYTGP